MDPKEEQPTPEEEREARQHAFQLVYAMDRACVLLAPAGPIWNQIQDSVRAYRASARDRDLLTLLDLLEGAIRDRSPTPESIAAARELTIAREFVKWMIRVKELGGNQ